jgi:hypothetical protein
VQAAAAGDDAAGVVAQGVGRREPRAAQRRHHAEHQTGEHSDGGAEAKHPPIHGEVERHHVGACGHQRHQPAAAPGREQQPEAGAEHGQHQALDQQLTHEQQPTGAERQAHRQFAATRHRLCQQQVGHVRAGNGQHQADNAQQHVERLAVARAQERDTGGRRRQHERLLNVFRLILRPPVLRHRGFPQRRLQPLEPGLRLSERLARGQAREQREPPETAAVERALRAADDRLGAERHRHVEGTAHGDAEELARRHADHREWVAVQGERPAHD